MTITEKSMVSFDLRTRHEEIDVPTVVSYREHPDPPIAITLVNALTDHVPERRAPLLGRRYA